MLLIASGSIHQVGADRAKFQRIPDDASAAASRVLGDARAGHVTLEGGARFGCTSCMMDPGHQTGHRDPGAPHLPATIAEAERVLRVSLSAPLPGTGAQQRLAPTPRRGWSAFPVHSPPKNASALLLLYPGSADLQLVLTVRSGALTRHSGQVSLPGGAWNPGESIEQAALREAHEEVGIDPAEVRVLGRLTPLDIPVSGFTLHPVVAVASRRPDLRAADGEVERILEVPLGQLLQPGRLRREKRLRDGVWVDVPYFDLGPDRLWGATAMVLSEFLWLLGWRPAAPQEAADDMDA